MYLLDVYQTRLDKMKDLLQSVMNGCNGIKRKLDILFCIEMYQENFKNLQKFFFACIFLDTIILKK